jgi:hypothetical protein
MEAVSVQLHTYFVSISRQLIFYLSFCLNVPQPTGKTQLAVKINNDNKDFAVINKWSRSTRPHGVTFLTIELFIVLALSSQN